MSRGRMPLANAKRLIALCAAILLAAVLSACSSDNVPGGADAPVPPDSSVTATATATATAAQTGGAELARSTESVGSDESVIPTESTPTETTTSESTPTETTTSESTPTEPADISIVGSWDISHAADTDAGTDIQLQDIYGTGIAYGGVLSLNQDGTFSKYIGITNGDTDAYEGLYSVTANAITLEYRNGTIEHAEYLPESGELRVLTTYYAGNTSAWEYFIRSENGGSQGDGFDFGALEGLAFTDSSGAGAWSTVLEIRSDGSFTGRYADDDMGDRAADYPNGTRYVWDFGGMFSPPEKADDDSYAEADGYVFDLKCESLTPPSAAAGEETIVEGVRSIVADVLGSDLGVAVGDYVLFLPGTSFHVLPEAVVQKNGRRADGSVNPTLDFYALYFPLSDVAFVSEAQNQYSQSTGY